MATLNARRSLQHDDLYEMNDPLSTGRSNRRHHHDSILLAIQKPSGKQKGVPFASGLAIGTETETVIRADPIRL
jgi:hypothetical protein